MEELKKRLEGLRGRWKELPGSSRILFIVGAAILVAAGVFAYATVTATSYDVLFANLPEEDAAEIVERLKAMKVPVRVTDGGATLEVPSDQVYETRLSLAAEGLPTGGSVGFEIFDEQRFGESEFSEHIKYHRALEGELARTITHLTGVERARVHLVLPERTLFLNKTQTASASVALQLKPGWTVREERVTGIVNLVASSVRGLEPAHVTVVDGQGKQLNRNQDADGDVSSSAQDFRRQLEEEKAESIQEILDRTVGPGKAVVSVSADINFTREERTEELFDPESVAPRSFQLDEERDPGAAGNATGVPGAVSNLPGGEAGQVGPNQAGLMRRSETRNFEVSKTVRRAVEPVGRLSRLHVAVVVDGEWSGEGEEKKFTPRGDEELAQLKGIIASAVGIDEERGDRLTVECVPLLALPEPVVVEPLFFEPYLPYAPYAKWALAILAGILALLYLRRKWKAFVKREEERRKAALLPVRELPGGQGGEGGGGAGELSLPDIPVLEPDSRAEDIRVMASELAEKDPEMAARVIKVWLSEDQDEREGQAEEQEAAA